MTRRVPARVRRLCGALALLAIPWTLPAQASPLDRRVSLQFRDMSLRDALDRVMAVAHVRISYSAELLPLDRAVRANFDSATVGSVLETLLRDAAVMPVVTGSQIVLTPVRDERGLAPTPPMRIVGTAELDRVVVTGTADGGAQRALPVALAVIDGNEARRAGWHDLASAFAAMAPGVWAWEQSPSSLIARYASVRGASSFGATYPKMYVDGIAVANPLLVTQFDPESIERIEVIRGPQGAALYGADAISGVLNIVTRHDGVDAGAPRARLSTSAGYSASDFTSSTVLAQDHRLAFGVGSGVRTAQFGLGLGSLGAFYDGAESRALQASAGARLIGEHTVLTGTARFVSGTVGATLNPLLVEAVLNSGQPVSTSALQAQSQGLQEYTVGTTLKYAPNDRWTHSLVAGIDGYALTHIANDFTPFPSSTDSALRASSGAANRTTLRASSVARFGEPERVGATVTLAAEHSALWQESPEIRLGRGPFMHEGTHGMRDDGWLSAQMASGELVARTDWFNDVGVTSQFDLAIRRAWYLSAGLRVERNSGYVTSARAHALPMLGAAWVHDLGGVTLKLRGAFGRGIRAPRTAARETLAGGFRAQAVVRDLAPEEQSGIEGGVDVLFGTQAALHVTRFDQRATGLIQQVVIPDSTRTTAGTLGGGLALQYQNVGAISNRGWEVQGTMRHGPLSGTVSYATVDSRVRSLAAGYTGDLRTGDRMLGVPARTLSATAAWSAARWEASIGVARAFDWIEYDRLSLATAYVGFNRGDVPLYGADLRGYWRNYGGNTRLRATFTRVFARGVSFVISGENLLNFQRGEPDNATIVPGRTLTTGLRLSRF